MKTVITLLLSLVSLTALANGSGHGHINQGGIDRSVANQGSKHSSLDSVLESNDKLYQALLKDDQSAVETAAQGLSGKLAASGNKELIKSSEHLKAITKSNSKEKNLEHYSAFMPTLIKEFKAAKSISDYEVYYCPMVKKSWIQNKKTVSGVKNVFAQEMLECGGKES